MSTRKWYLIDDEASETGTNPSYIPTSPKKISEDESYEKSFIDDDSITCEPKGNKNKWKNDEKSKKKIKSIKKCEVSKLVVKNLEINCSCNDDKKEVNRTTNNEREEQKSIRKNIDKKN